MLFAHLKRILKLDRLRLRGLTGAHDEFLLAATAQNLRRMAKRLMDAKQGALIAGLEGRARSRTAACIFKCRWLPIAQATATRRPRSLDPVFQRRSTPTGPSDALFVRKDRTYNGMAGGLAWAGKRDPLSIADAISSWQPRRAVAQPGLTRPVTSRKRVDPVAMGQR